MRRLARRRGREGERAFVVEGEDLVLAGLELGASPRVLLVDAERVPELDASLVPCPLLEVAPELMASVSELAHPPRVIGVFELPPARSLAELLAARRAPWLLLDAVHDPGNVGTAIRSAAAFGAGGVAITGGSADPWGGKAVRASMGSLFRVPLVRIDDPVAALDGARASVDGLQVLALDADGDVDLWEAPLRDDTVLVLGGERDGISRELLAAADVRVRIPHDAAVDSLNAGVAASLALYEWRRRRA